MCCISIKTLGGKYSNHIKGLHDSKKAVSFVTIFHIDPKILITEQCKHGREVYNLINRINGKESPVKISLKLLLFTASHSLKSSPGGNFTASLRLPLPKVASICF